MPAFSNSTMGFVMRFILATIMLVCLFASPGYAMWNMGEEQQIQHKHYQQTRVTAQHRWERIAAREITSVGIALNAGIRDAAYWLATRQGGPCGLTVERLVYGRSDHVLNGWNPWMARAWLRFERAAPSRGMVAVWRNGRHVEMVERDNGDGTIATRGSVGFARVSLRSVIIVNPHARRERYAGV